MTAGDAIDLIKALSGLAWPLIVAALLAALYPTLKTIVRSRSFTVKVAGMEVSVQDAAEQLRAQVEDLQHQVIALRGESSPAKAAKVNTAARSMARPQVEARDRGARVLWVDDNMSNNAFQIAQLHDQGITVVQSGSTPDAMSILGSSPPFDAVISDMGRREGGTYQGQAGLNLLKTMREAHIDTPFMVYSSQRYADRNRQAIQAAGGDGATSSPVELIEWVRQKTRTTTRG
jgi:CheY-like chemotaxis protein